VLTPFTVAVSGLRRYPALSVSPEEPVSVTVTGPAASCEAATPKITTVPSSILFIRSKPLSDLFLAVMLTEFQRHSCYAFRVPLLGTVKRHLVVFVTNTYVVSNLYCYHEVICGIGNRTDEPAKTNAAQEAVLETTTTDVNRTYLNAGACAGERE
jgi:hypothetical protein